jgi:hypothetical protein
MPASYVRVPPDGTGKKLRTRERSVGADVVHEQMLVLGAEPCWYLRSGPLACAANKIFLAFLNNAGSGQVLKVRRIWIQNAQLPAITSGTAPATVGMMQFDVKRITAATGGTALTANPIDTVDGALPTYTAYATATGVTESTVLYPWYTNNDEIGLTGGFPQAIYQQVVSSLIDGWEIRELTLNPGEGFCVKQITNFTLGQFDVLAVIAKDLG